MYTSAHIVTAVLLILILGTVLYLALAVYQSPPLPSVRLKCPAGECPTNLQTGEKRCPASSETALLYDPSTEICNSRFTCESKLRPYAVRGDGSTNAAGVCEVGAECRCLAHPQCPTQSLVVFSMKNGSTYLQDSATSRALFSQIPLPAQDGNPTTLTYTDPNTQFCGLKAYHLDRLAPGSCAFVNPSNPTLPEVVTCLQTNPCLTGVLAFVPPTAAGFSLHPNDLTALNEIPVMCVPGLRRSISQPTSATGANPCTGNTVPVWDNATTSVRCLSVD